MFSLKSLAQGCAVLGMSLAAAGTAQAGAVLDKIKERGEIVACIKVDYRPFGFRDPSGGMIGLEHDLVDDIQARLSAALGKPIKVQRVPVIAANRVQFLEQGKCDMLMATMTDTPERRRLIRIVEPNYYASGITVMAKKSTPIKKWDDIRGQTLCTSQGAFWNKEYERKYELKLLAFAGIAESEQALRDGRCIGSLTDDSLAASRLTDKEIWGDYEIKLPTQDTKPWGLAVQHGDDDLFKLMTAASIDWHKTGKIVTLEKKWGIEPTDFIKDLHEKYKAK
ncbi:transporter substrate-binding domain-containing protein [Reyranella sp. CPCC 100927]|nr:transporter substrate-binding domain-containing protein [Reyranella sp. CPCC 100927]